MLCNKISSDVAAQSVLLTTVQCLKKKVRQPGIEPGSIAWKATMLTFTPPTLLSKAAIARVVSL